MSFNIKAGPVDGKKIAPALESLIQRLSLIYPELKGQNISTRAFVH
jgi:hypothetical protein